MPSFGVRISVRHRGHVLRQQLFCTFELFGEVRNRNDSCAGGSSVSEFVHTHIFAGTDDLFECGLQLSVVLLDLLDVVIKCSW